ncbi:MAG: carbamoyltransferase HypF [Anaerolineales bacterium]|jgi:hydrogenase maturation protein HypF|nr:carbamoyltransferase HypF [Anaerolineales bacterium]
MPARQIHITGIVQGVGFRPFVFGLADQFQLYGWVCNTSAGVDIHVEGDAQSLHNFEQLLRHQPPPLARIDSYASIAAEHQGYTQFSIKHSEPIPGAYQPISPDVCTCNDCLAELHDPADRRYLYPFTNCTNCGPRFTIITDIPYDRPNTTMADFPLCPACAAEYADPRNRRFHAQPVACPECGPHVWLEPGLEAAPAPSAAAFAGVSPANLPSVQAVFQTQQMLAGGKILAVKGLGGFHLACDALNADAVSQLRERKLRVDKPFAVMMPDLPTIERYCEVSPSERELLQSPARPIVILQQRAGTPIAPQVAPGQTTLGVMLPYTPLHTLLFTELPVQAHPLTPPQVLVMTSGNLSEEPIAIDNQEARQRLKNLVDAYLFHNRPIRTRSDDSVARVIPAAGDSFQALLRRSRGYTPYPVKLPWELPPLLGAGPELKNTFCLARGPYAFVSHHIGDLENLETLQSFEDGIQHFERLFRIQPERIAYDLHPNYLSTRYALARAERENLPLIGIQHHHAHIAACMAEHSLPDEPVIGVSLDGTGYGTDGAIWGGEFLLASYSSCRRVYHLAYSPLPGGDAAVRNPARIALAYLWANGLDWEADLPPVKALCAQDLTTLRLQLEHQVNTPRTSSMGRLFDAAAALAGVRQRINYEAQAAIEFEALCDPEESRSYPFPLPSPREDPTPIPLTAFLQAFQQDCLARLPVPLLSGKFHNTIADLVVLGVMAMRNLQAHAPVVLSGGVWQNRVLLTKTLARLQQAGVSPVYMHQVVPTNDGGISLGQAVIAFHQK